MDTQFGRVTGSNSMFEYSKGSGGLTVKREGFGGMDDNTKGNQSLVGWLNKMVPDLSLPCEASDEELRVRLIDGTFLCSLLNKLVPGAIKMGGFLESDTARVDKFLSAMEKRALPSFKISDLEQGHMVPVLQCLKALKASSNFSDRVDGNSSHSIRGCSVSEVDSVESKVLHDIHNPVISDQSASLTNHSEPKFHEEFKLDQFSGAITSEFLRLKSLEDSTIPSLLSMLDKILDESIQRRDGDVSHRVAYLLRGVLQVVDQKLSSQAEKMNNQNKLFAEREEKYQSKLRVLETLAAGAIEENKIVMNKLEQIKLEKAKVEEREKIEQHNTLRLKKEKDESEKEILNLKEELNSSKRAHENRCLEMEARAEKREVELQKKIKEMEHLLTDSRRKVKELESFTEAKSTRWKKKEHTYKSFIDNQFGALKELRSTSELIKHEVLKRKRSYNEELNYLGVKLRGLADAAQNYHSVLLENRRLYNEVQDLKGNIRVYCRIRPFLPGQSKKQTTIEFIGDNGELVVVNPLKQGKDTRRLFKFNKVFGPTTTQEEVFLDTRPLIRSVLDGYNVCIFAYGQTGSGKTYTMSGPNESSREDWGVNYRALNDLFHISQTRQNTIVYEVCVQMVEIYNEQVRDLLTGGSQRRLEIWATTQPNGLAVPEASMHPVRSTEDVLKLMTIGLKNRAVGATALNERSSRSHSVLTVHVRGIDLETDAVLRGNLHLVDLAGSERVDRSEATGDRLREAQHINKSLSALGDVIYALAQKNSHVPYRNSKLTQVLQSSLGGQAKTLMFVQINPDIESYSETISTLKFAERVSGVELGAAQSSKEGPNVRELMDQVSSLKDVIAKKDEEIERVQQLKGNANVVKDGINSLRFSSSSLRRHSIGASPQSKKISGGKGKGLIDKAASDADYCSESSDKHSEAGSQHSVDELRLRKEYFAQCKDAERDEIELLGLRDANSEERLSDISDGELSMGTETDGSIGSIVEFKLFPETSKPAAEKAANSVKTSISCKPLKPAQKSVQVKSSRLSMAAGTSSKVLTSARKPPILANTSLTTSKSKRWQ